MEEIMKKSLFAIVFLFLAAPALAEPSAFVTIAPQKYFVDQVSGGKVPVSVMVEPGANPHAYEPKPRQMTELAKAKIYFTIGDTFDNVWLPRIRNASPGITVAHTEEGVAKIPMAEHHHHDHEGEEHDHDHADHEHGPDCDHDHGTLDPHIWLDPALVKIQARNIRDGLSRIDPAQSERYAANTAAFEQKLDRLDQDIRAILKPLPENRRTFLVFHPSWGYFAKAYGLHQVSVEVDGKEPSPKELSAIISKARETGAKVIFVQPQFSEKSAAVIAQQIGAQVVRLDPLAEDWEQNMLRAARAFADALK